MKRPAERFGLEILGLAGDVGRGEAEDVREERQRPADSDRVKRGGQTGRRLLAPVVEADPGEIAK